MPDTRPGLDAREALREAIAIIDETDVGHSSCNLNVGGGWAPEPVECTCGWDEKRDRWLALASPATGDSRPDKVVAFDDTDLMASLYEVGDSRQSEGLRDQGGTPMSDPRDTALASLICERNDHPDAPACDGCYAMAAHLRENGYAAATPEPTLDADELRRGFTLHLAAILDGGTTWPDWHARCNEACADDIAARLHERTEP